MQLFTRGLSRGLAQPEDLLGNKGAHRPRTCWLSDISCCSGESGRAASAWRTIACNCWATTPSPSAAWRRWSIEQPPFRLGLALVQPATHKRLATTGRCLGPSRHGRRSKGIGLARRARASAVSLLVIKVELGFDLAISKSMTRTWGRASPRVQQDKVMRLQQGLEFRIRRTFCV